MPSPAAACRFFQEKRTEETCQMLDFMASRSWGRKEALPDGSEDRIGRWIYPCCSKPTDTPPCSSCSTSCSSALAANTFGQAHLGPKSATSSITTDPPRGYAHLGPSKSISCEPTEVSAGDAAVASADTIRPALGKAHLGPATAVAAVVSTADVINSALGYEHLGAIETVLEVFGQAQ